VLVLTRKAGERLLIGDDIVITILDSRGDGVRVGIDAPRGVKIQREEVVRAVTEANLAAAQVDEQAEARIRAALGQPPAAPPAEPPADS
jgi:carbon storage regulator